MSDRLLAVDELVWLQLVARPDRWHDVRCEDQVRVHDDPAGKRRSSVDQLPLYVEPQRRADLLHVRLSSFVGAVRSDNRVIDIRPANQHDDSDHRSRVSQHTLASGRGRVSETSAEVERAGSPFGVLVSLSPEGGWVADSATLLAFVARLSA